MSDTRDTRTTAAQVPQQTRGIEETTPAQSQPQTVDRAPAPEVTTRGGWLAFASMMLVMAGIFQGIAGFTALLNSGYYGVPAQDLLVSVDFTAWGWTHIALGALAVAAAFGILAGQMWARVVGIAIAAGSAFVNLAFLSAYPTWSTVVIALDVLVIYAITVHGSEA